MNETNSVKVNNLLILVCVLSLCKRSRVNIIEYSSIAALSYFCYAHTLTLEVYPDSIVALIWLIAMVIYPLMEQS